MKLKYLLFLLFFCSCEAFRYYPPRPNPATLKDKGETHINVDIGYLGSSLKLAYAPTDHIGLMGLYNTGISEYRVKEGELAIGYYAATEKLGFFLSAGFGLGTNYEYKDETYTDKLYRGYYRRAIIQSNLGYNTINILGMRSEVVFILKGSHLHYEGKHFDGTNHKILSSYYLLEPLWSVSIGGRRTFLNQMLGFNIPSRSLGINARHHVKPFPINYGIGLRYIIGRE